MILQTKATNLAVREYKEKLRLENVLMKELVPLFNAMNRSFAVKYGASGRILDFSVYKGDVSYLLRRHYERVQKSFRGVVLDQQEKKFPHLVSIKQEENNTLIKLGLFAWIEQQLKTQPELIIQTTQKQADQAVRRAITQLNEEGGSIDSLNVARTAAIINKRQLFGRLEGIASAETQSTAEFTKLIEAEVLSGRTPNTIPFDPFARTRPREGPLKEGEKSWVDVGDGAVRDSHRAENVQTVGIDDVFIVGGFEMRMPGDMTLGAPVKQWIKCRCSANIQIRF